MSKSDRRNFFKTAGKITVLGGLAAGIWGLLLEPFMPQRTDISIKLPNLGGKMTLAQLSDFHAGPRVATQIITRAIDIARDANPDIVIITGDFVSYKAKYAPIVLTELKRLNPPLGIWACLGNHDHWAGREAVLAQLEKAGINVLSNRGTTIEHRGARFFLCGVDDIWEGADDLSAALADHPPNIPTVLLCHNPDFIYTAARHKVDLMLSGHTHGGQVRLPFLGAPIVPSEYGDRFAQGYHRVEGTQLYVNRGIGVITPPIRFGVPPEVTVITMTDYGII
jgi:predicted MPP superfamily phosphohydrolase